MPGCISVLRHHACGECPTCHTASVLEVGINQRPSSNLIWPSGNMRVSIGLRTGLSTGLSDPIRHNVVRQMYLKESYAPRKALIPNPNQNPKPYPALAFLQVADPDPDHDHGPKANLNAPN